MFILKRSCFNLRIRARRSSNSRNGVDVVMRTCLCVQRTRCKPRGAGGSTGGGWAGRGESGGVVRGPLRSLPGTLPPSRPLIWLCSLRGPVQASRRHEKRKQPVPAFARLLYFSLKAAVWRCRALQSVAWDVENGGRKRG